MSNIHFKMSKAFSITAIISVSMLAAVTSCGHKDIVCPASDGINVVFEWNNASDADVDGMTLFFYPLDENERIWRFDIAGREGGPVRLPSGTYEMIACNNDLPGIILGDTENPSTLYASARSVVTGEDHGVFASSGMLYCAKISRLEVTPCGVRYVSDAGIVKECSRGIVRAHPDSIATVYTVRLIHVDGLERIRRAVVTLEGVRSDILLESSIPSDIPASLAIDMFLDHDYDSVSGQGCAFAPLDLISADYKLRLLIECADGKTIVRDIDVMPDNLNTITRHNVIITIDGIAIPDGGSSGDIGGIGAIVDGWEVIEIDLEPTF